MTPRKMDYKDVQRIAKARGQNDSFSKRAAMAARNGDQSSKEQEGSSGKQEQGMNRDNEKTGSKK
ncbi:hypothetical protein SAMD00023353_4100840 [Rosellinia necatrix]|uniref:Uncharacterized protein n=1 Tax=Rosellinia necatrix TaxID=77044 RepID=A0A1S8A9E1_ROSNE|nr:hypothetical protein SAMD00023353_4100840 [Rosellinia necatrix]